ncbi:hypothetical protein EIP91_010462 [Steccherinum ochraceum]|uniref:Carboxylic ester hydrolase n=1 Tax=Steccherinum ochraceum TaxID=92696 RepID=A0A4V2MX32_9APHY|nr:hypothetical protein EIP91_010462 [Steccherinum ochraceum]
MDVVRIMVLAYCIATVRAAQVQEVLSVSPLVKLDHGNFLGSSDGITFSFLGIPFAKAPIGDRRFRVPVPDSPYTGTHVVTNFGPTCPQQRQKLQIPPELSLEGIDYLEHQFMGVAGPESEDCLTLNVWVPAGLHLRRGSKLPVVVWIYGGGFQTGGTNSYDGGIIVRRSLLVEKPVIFVSMNYRVSAFGFLAGKEVRDAGVGNLGLHDQRLALHWVQKYASAFGGDPDRVIIWGESAGADSVALQILTNGGDTEGLFHGAFMQSGSPIPSGDITRGQKHYDNLVSHVGCAQSNDTLQCLRDAPYDKLKAAVDASPGIMSYQSLALAWLPRVDGVFLADTPQNLVLQGSVAKVPFVTGDCDDEGTAFALSSLNITNETQLRTYIKTFFLPRAPESDIDELLALYPDDTTKGSPFDTGALNALTPQFKRIAALLGDFVFQGPRRFLLQQTADRQDAWSFLSKRFKIMPVLGSAHGTDMASMFGPGDLTDHLIYFAHNLDPNGPTVAFWPKYNTSAIQQLLLQPPGYPPQEIMTDDYREKEMAFAIRMGLENPL